jgi:hypothetical protein
VSPDAECHALSAGRHRWLEFLELQHATLPPAVDLERVGDAVRVHRRPIEARSLSEAPAGREHGAALFLQGAAAAAFFAAHGFPLAAEDLENARAELRGGEARFWLTGAPRSVASDGPGRSPRAPASAAEALSALLVRLFARGRRITHRGAAQLLDRLAAPDARWKRPEFWIASAFRAFPELASPAAAAWASAAIRSAPARRAPSSPRREPWWRTASRGCFAPRPRR